MMPVQNQFCPGLSVRQYCPNNAWVASLESAHRVKQMGAARETIRILNFFEDGLYLLGGGNRMSDADPHASSGEHFTRFKCMRLFGGNRHDPNHIVLENFSHQFGFGFDHKIWLSTETFGTDKGSLEMDTQNLGTRTRLEHDRFCILERGNDVIPRVGNCRGEQRCCAVFDMKRRHAANAVSPVHRVKTAAAVHMNVNKPGHDIRRIFVASERLKIGDARVKFDFSRLPAIRCKNPSLQRGHARASSAQSRNWLGVTGCSSRRLKIVVLSPCSKSVLSRSYPVV